MKAKKCEWSNEDEWDHNGAYDTECGRTFLCIDGSEDILDWAKYCPFCGGKISIAPIENDKSK
jgi:hypothetical protein